MPSVGQTSGVPDIAISDLVRRQTADSRFTHFDFPWDELIPLVQEHWADRQPGYREGVVLVPVPPEKFWCSTITLKAGDRLEGIYEARMEGEEPRKSTWVSGRSKQPAAAVDVVLYRHDVLAENDEQSSEADWEIISINGRPTKDPMPMQPGTLMANHFEISGGTATKLLDHEFVAKLRESFLYWRDKSLVQG